MAIPIQLDAPRVAYPAVMVTAFVLHAVVLRAGLPIGVSSYTAVVFGAVAVTLLEFAIPYDRSWQPNKADVKNDLLFMVLVQIVLPPLMTLFFGITLIRFLQTLDVPMAEWWPRDLPEIIQVGADAAGCGVLPLLASRRRPQHETLAAARRATTRPRSSTGSTWAGFHPVEKALQYLLDALPFILIGVGEQVFAGYLIFYAVNGFFQHSNVDARYGVLNYVVSGAELHRWRHSNRIEESNNNYGNNFIVWDLVFCSWFLPKDRRVGDLGLLNPDYPLNFVSQLTTPLKSGLDKQGATPNAS